MVHSITRRAALATIASSALALTTARSSFGADLSGTGEVVVMDGGGSLGEAQRIAYREPFEKLTGIKVRAVPYIPTGALRTSIQAGAPAYDVFHTSGGEMPRLMADGMLEKIDYKHFAAGQKEQLAPVAATDFYVPTMFYSMIIAYDPEQFASKPPKSWADFWDSKNFPGKRSLFNAGDDAVAGALFEIAMMADGADVNSVYPIDFKRAFAALDRIKPDVLRYWTAGAEPAQLLSDALVSMASAWNGRISALQAQGVPVGMSFNQAVLQWDAWAIPHGSKNVDNALKFLAFTARAEQQAIFAQHIDYGPPNAEAFKLLPKDRAAKLPGNTLDASLQQVVQNYDWWNQTADGGKNNIVLANELWQKWVSK